MTGSTIPCYAMHDAAVQCGWCTQGQLLDCRLFPELFCGRAEAAAWFWASGVGVSWHMHSQTVLGRSVCGWGACLQPNASRGCIFRRLQLPQVGAAVACLLSLIFLMVVGGLIPPFILPVVCSTCMLAGGCGHTVDWVGLHSQPAWRAANLGLRIAVVRSRSTSCTCAFGYASQPDQQQCCVRCS